jgi:hypothetical protein
VAARVRSVFFTTIPRFFNQFRTAISICVVTGMPSVCLTRRIVASSSASIRSAVVSFGLISLPSTMGRRMSFGFPDFRSTDSFDEFRQPAQFCRIVVEQGHSFFSLTYPQR